MQSFRQYRRFEHNARLEYQRLKNRQQALERQHEDNAPREDEHQPRRPSSTDSTQTSHSHDPEKAEVPKTEVPKAEVPPGFLSANGAGSNGPTNEGLERALTLTTIKTTRSFRTRIGDELVGIEVRQLSKELTKTRMRKSGRKPPTNENGEERETVFVVGYDCEQDKMNPRTWSNLVRISSTLLIASIVVVTLT
jgi:hypothetical protein